VVATSHTEFQRDVHLMQMVAAGDDRARRVLAMRVMRPTRRIAHVLLGSSPDVDDAAQVALIEILRAAGSYRGESSLERWSQRIAVRAVLRSGQVQRRRSQRIDAAVEPETLRAVFGESMFSEQLARPLPEYLAMLDPRRCRALVLRHALGYSAAEIAELTETPLSTVKHQISRALQQLRKAIGRDTLVGRKSRGGER